MIILIFQDVHFFPLSLVIFYFVFSSFKPRALNLFFIKFYLYCVHDLLSSSVKMRSVTSKQHPAACKHSQDHSAIFDRVSCGFAQELVRRPSKYCHVRVTILSYEKTEVLVGEVTMKRAAVSTGHSRERIRRNENNRTVARGHFFRERSRSARIRWWLKRAKVSTLDEIGLPRLFA